MTQAAILAASGSPGTTTGFKNRIINGNMVIDQRNAGATTTSNAGVYTLDRWVVSATQNTATIGQNYGGVTPPAGFSNYFGLKITTTASLGAGDYNQLIQVIEGYNIADLAWGTANAKSITISFWVYSSVTGTFGGTLRNGSLSRSYPFTYSIPTANTWTYITITVPGDTTGTWNSNSTQGIYFTLSYGAGSNYSGTANAWAATNYNSATGATSIIGTLNATFYFTGVQIEVGTTATNFDFRSYGTELVLCQRYYTKSYDINSAVPVVNSVVGSVAGWSTGGIAFFGVQFKVSMRTTPTVTTYSYQGTPGYIGGGSNAALPASTYQQGTSGFNVSSSGNGGNDTYCNYSATAEL